MNIWRQRIEDWRTSKNATAVRGHDDQLTWNEVAEISDELISKIEDLGQDTRPIVILAVPRGPMACALAAGLLASNACGMALDRNTVNVTLTDVLAFTSATAIVIKASDLEMFKGIALGYLEQKLQSAQGYLWLTKSDLVPELSLDRTSSVKWLIQTSGTTRSPKIVMIADDDLVARALGEIRDFDLHPEDEVLNALPLSHDVGFNQILSWVMSGLKLRVFTKLSSSELFRTLDRDGITGVSGTPLLWIGLLRELPSEVKKAEPNRTLKYLTVSGGSLEAAMIDRLRSHFKNAVVIKTYGQTETFRSLISKTFSNEKLPDSLGFPLAGVTLELLDESNSPIRGAGHGQLLHRGQGTMIGYLKDQTAPGGHDQKDHQRSGIRTGDYFDRDEAGAYYFKGRRDDLIKRWEHRLYLSETEEALRELPYIEQAIVLHRPIKDARQNEMAAFVTLVPGIADDVREAVIQHCKTYLPPQKVPDEIFVLPTMPQTESLKVDRRQLHRYWEITVVKPRN
ncbi:MAG: long-chain fatty acid--CoA ligase [Deltaproteobacteria bacterium]|jgi:acyl-coenzyme A synthetase/AMP-(fatty) acid ligase|nr:long-chain fatty acid--CoA ligase [Deltaproteobacteria bacterium]